MAITVWLIDATPYRLRYKCHQDGEQGVLYTIPNQGGATPDLRTDALNGAVPGAGGIPISNLIRARIDGYPVPGAGVLAAATALTQAQARAIMNSDDAAGAMLTNFLMPRAVTTITPMTNAIAWAATWNVDVDGDPVCEVRAPTGTNCYATLDIWVRHTFAL